MAICFISAAMRHRLNRLPFAEEAIIAGHLIHGDGFLSPYDASPKARQPATARRFIRWSLRRRISSRALRAVPVLLAVNSASFGVIAAGIFRLGRFYLSPLAGWVAALLLAVHPVLLYFITDWWDSYVALAIFIALIVVAAEMPKWRRMPGCALMGAMMGVLSLTNPSYLLSYPLLILFGLRGLSWRQRLSGVAVCLAGFIVVLTPWTIRNAFVFDRFIPVRGGAGYYLWLGNQPAATGWLEGDMLNAGPAVSHSERALILTMGEPKYFDLCDARLKREYGMLPGNSGSVRPGDSVSYS